MKSLLYKNYCVTIETDTTKYFPNQPEATRGIYYVWQSNDGVPGRQIYCGHTSKLFKSDETAAMIEAAEAEARGWIDTNAGKPWA